MSTETNALRDALQAIFQYGSDTLSGRVDGPDDREWQRGSVKEMTRRARAALAQSDAQPDTAAAKAAAYEAGRESMRQEAIRIVAPTTTRGCDCQRGGCYCGNAGDCAAVAGWDESADNAAAIAAIASSPQAPPPEAAQPKWTDAKLRGIASDYFPESKDWPAAMLCLRHLLMEQAKYPEAQPEAAAVPVAWVEASHLQEIRERAQFAGFGREIVAFTHSRTDADIPLYTHPAPKEKT